MSAVRVMSARSLVCRWQIVTVGNPISDGGFKNSLRARQPYGTGPAVVGARTAH